VIEEYPLPPRRAWHSPEWNIPALLRGPNAGR